MKPIKRNKHFNLNPKNVNTWHKSGVGVTSFLNALSLFFPEGERYFIRSVRAFKNTIPIWLKDNVSNFIGQEAFHGREHQVLNDMLTSPKFEAFLKIALTGLSERLPNNVNLATTISLEHITAILADGLLEDVETFLDSDPEYRDMWIWHALEETEHKSVAFDVYQYAMPGSDVKKYALRSAALIISTAILIVAVSERYVRIMRRNGELNIKNVSDTLRFMFMYPGIIRKVIPKWFHWFHPDFHPSQHDNYHVLTDYQDFLNK